MALYYESAPIPCSSILSSLEPVRPVLGCPVLGCPVLSCGHLSAPSSIFCHLGHSSSPHTDYLTSRSAPLYPFMILAYKCTLSELPTFRTYCRTADRCFHQPTRTSSTFPMTPVMLSGASGAKIPPRLPVEPCSPTLARTCTCAHCATTTPLLPFSTLSSASRSWISSLSPPASPFFHVCQFCAWLRRAGKVVWSRSGAVQRRGVMLRRAILVVLKGLWNKS